MKRIKLNLFGLMVSFLLLGASKAYALQADDKFVTTNLNTSMRIPMSATGGNPANYSFSYVQLSQTIGTVAQVPGTNELDYTPAPGFAGIDSFVYLVSETVSPGSVNTSAGRVIVAVNIPNSAISTEYFILHTGLTPNQWVSLGTQTGLGQTPINFNLSSITPRLTSGQYQFRYEVRIEGRGAVSGGTGQHLVDMDAPIVTFTNYPGFPNQTSPFRCVGGNMTPFRVTAVDGTNPCHIQTPQYIDPATGLNTPFTPFGSGCDDYIVLSYNTNNITNSVGDGLHQFEAFASDTPGNESQHVSFQVQVDNTAPTNLNLSFAPALSPSARVNGTVNVQLTATDATCGMGSLELLAESASSTSLGSNANQGTFSSQWITSNFDDGDYRIRGIAQDMMGNSNFMESPIIHVDNTGPVLDNIATSNITTTDVTIGWNTNELADSQVEYGLTTAYGSTTGLNSVLSTSHSHPISGLTVDTLYHFRVISHDDLGNPSVSNDMTFRTAINPTGSAVVRVTSPAEGRFVRGNNVLVSADANITPLGVQFKLDGANLGQEVTSAPFQTNWVTTSGSNGAHILSAEARYALNTAVASDVQVNVDNVLPTITQFLPADSSTVSGFVMLEMTAQDAGGLEQIGFTVNGIVIASKFCQGTTNPDSLQFSFNSVSAPNNSYTIVANAMDRAGNIQSVSHIIQIQNSSEPAPIVRILTPVLPTPPLTTTFVRGVIPVRAQITNHPTPNSVVLRVNNGLPISGQLDPSTQDIYEFIWDTTQPAIDGVKTLEVSANNGSGPGLDTRIVEVDNTPPTVTWILPDPNSTTTPIFFLVSEVSVNVGDGPSHNEVQEVKFYLDDTDPEHVIGSFSPQATGVVSRVWDTLAEINGQRRFTEGPHQLFVSVRDHANNSTILQRGIEIDQNGFTPSQGHLDLHPLPDSFVTSNLETEISVHPVGVSINPNLINEGSFQVSYRMNGVDHLLPGSIVMRNGDAFFSGTIPQNSRVTVRAQFLDNQNNLLFAVWSFVYGTDRTQPTTVTSEDNGVTITVQIPANTLERDAVVEIVPLTGPNQIPSAMEEANQAPSPIPNLTGWKFPYRLTAKDSSDQEVNMVPGNTASFTFQDQIPDPFQKFVFRTQFLDETNNLWRLLDGHGLLGASDAPVAKTITSTINQFGYFRIVNFPSSSSGISEVFNFPNPFSPREGGTTLSYLLSEDSEVTLVIYDLFGSLVKKINIAQGAPGGTTGLNNVVWMGDNGEGHEVANGGYIVQILAKGASGSTYKERHKMAVLK